MPAINNKLIREIESFQTDIDTVEDISVLKEQFHAISKKLIKDINRQDKILARSDKQQRHDYDELQEKLFEVEALQKEIQDTQKEVIFTMGSIGETRSKETGNHVKRVAEYSRVLAQYYGLEHKDIEMLREASPMHDIGKVAIPDDILNKPGRLTNSEFGIMKNHSALGYEMLKHSNRPLMKLAATIAYEHHERWDGKGYPNGLRGEQISIQGRITALADVFDALGSDRCYKSAWKDEDIFKLFKEERGKQFEPKLVDIFFEHLDEFLAIRDQFKDIVE